MFTCVTLPRTLKHRLRHVPQDDRDALSVLRVELNSERCVPKMDVQLGRHVMHICHIDGKPVDLLAARTHIFGTHVSILPATRADLFAATSTRAAAALLVFESVCYFAEHLGVCVTVGL